jgi:hypothetical protein
MITVEAIHVAPVKSLGLTQPSAVEVSPAGILEDRRFYLVDQRGGLVTQRDIGGLVQVKAEYRTGPGWLKLDFPGGPRLEGPVEVEEPVTTAIFGRRVDGQLVSGSWSAGLSDFCGQPVRLVRSLEPCQCYDEYPVSLLSQASLRQLDEQQDGGGSFGSERFRPNFLLAGCEAHEEDSWLGEVVAIGPALRLRVIAMDPRCAITTHSPATGERDIDTLRLILRYRPNRRAAFFGVYAIVERTGAVSLGDAVAVVSGVKSAADLNPTQG